MRIFVFMGFMIWVYAKIYPVMVFAVLGFMRGGRTGFGHCLPGLWEM